MPWFDWFSMAPKVPTSARPELENLEDRLVPATADLVAFRPVTDHLNTFTTANYRVADTQEESYTLGAGIRINGDDDNGNTVADRSDTGPLSAGDNDLVRVDFTASGTTTQVAYSSNLRVWNSATKSQLVASGAAVASGTYWVEYVGTTHTTGNTSATLDLTAQDGAGTATDRVVFHTFQSIVVAIGGRDQNPAQVGSSSLGTFTLAANLYQQGYDVQMYSHDKVSSNGTGSAYDEVVRAVTSREVDYVAIFGYSWGGGATYELANGLNNNNALRGQYTLKYTAYIDAITHGWISSERRLPPGTQYNDNVFQRRDFLLKGNTVSGSNNLNVNTTSWGASLSHLTIDDHANVQAMIFTNLTSRVVR